MSNSTFASPSRQRAICPACDGRGQIRTGDAVCARCDGDGFAIILPRLLPHPARERYNAVVQLFPKAPRGQPTLSYLATSGPDVIDESTDLDTFVREMREGWDTGELVIWSLVDEGDAVVLAILRPGPGGDAVVQWI